MLRLKVAGDGRGIPESQVPRAEVPSHVQSDPSRLGPGKTRFTPPTSDAPPARSDLAPAGSVATPRPSDAHRAGRGVNPARSEVNPAGSDANLAGRTFTPPKNEANRAGIDVNPAGIEPTPRGSEGNLPSSEDLPPPGETHLPWNEPIFTQLQLLPPAASTAGSPNPASAKAGAGHRENIPRSLMGAPEIPDPPPASKEKVRPG